MEIIVTIATLITGIAAIHYHYMKSAGFYQPHHQQKSGTLTDSYGATDVHRVLPNFRSHRACIQRGTASVVWVQLRDARVWLPGRSHYFGPHHRLWHWHGILGTHNLRSVCR